MHSMFWVRQRQRLVRVSDSERLLQAGALICCLLALLPTVQSKLADVTQRMEVRGSRGPWSCTHTEAMHGSPEHLVKVAAWHRGPAKVQVKACSYSNCFTCKCRDLPIVRRTVLSWRQPGSIVQKLRWVQPVGEQGCLRSSLSFRCLPFASIALIGSYMLPTLTPKLPVTHLHATPRCPCQAQRAQLTAAQQQEHEAAEQRVAAVQVSSSRVTSHVAARWAACTVVAAPCRAAL